MLTVQKQKIRTSLYELKVLAMMSQLKHYCSCLESFERCFNEDLQKMPRMSVGSPADFYRIKPAKNNTQLNVWHYNTLGEPDRLVAIITNQNN